jgi:hypothetical protein
VFDHSEKTIRSAASIFFIFNFIFCAILAIALYSLQLQRFFRNGVLTVLHCGEPS